MRYFLLISIFSSLPFHFQAAGLLSSGKTTHSSASMVSSRVDPFPSKVGRQKDISPLARQRAEIKRQHVFFKRVAMLRNVRKSFFGKSMPAEEISPADKKAKQSLWVGIIALAFAMIPWYTLFAAIPLGILALSMGGQAKRMGSDKINGRAFGIAALALVGLWLLLTALFVIAFALSWVTIF